MDRKFFAVGASKFQQRAPGILHIEYAPILRGIIRPAFLRNRKSRAVLQGSGEVVVPVEPFPRQRQKEAAFRECAGVGGDLLHRSLKPFCTPNRFRNLLYCHTFHSCIPSILSGGAPAQTGQNIRHDPTFVKTDRPAPQYLIILMPLAR